MLTPATSGGFFLVKLPEQFSPSLGSFTTSSLSAKAHSTCCQQRMCCSRQITSDHATARLFLTLLFLCLLQTSTVGLFFFTFPSRLSM